MNHFKGLCSLWFTKTNRPCNRLQSIFLYIIHPHVLFRWTSCNILICQKDSLSRYVFGNTLSESNFYAVEHEIQRVADKPSSNYYASCRHRRTAHNVAYIHVYTIFEGILPKGLTRHAYAWQIGPFWQDTLDIYSISFKNLNTHNFGVYKINNRFCYLL